MAYRFRMAQCLEEMGRREEAMAMYREILDIDVEFFSNMHLRELPWYQALYAEKLGLQQRAWNILGKYKREWSRTLTQTDNGFFATTPFSFAITVHYRLEEKGLSSVYHIQNTGKTPMPLTFGLHTTFQEPEQFRVPLASCQEKDARHIPTGRYVPLSPRETAYTQGSPSRGIPISGYYRAGGNVAQIGGFTYEVTGFDHWVLYNGGGQSGFLCVEPQLGAVDGLNRQSGCPVIYPGSHLSLKTRLFAPIQQCLVAGLGGFISLG